MEATLFFSAWCQHISLHLFHILVPSTIQQWRQCFSFHVVISMHYLMLSLIWKWKWHFRCYAHYWGNDAFNTLTPHEAKLNSVCVRTPQNLEFLSLRWFNFTLWKVSSQLSCECLLSLQYSCLLFFLVKIFSPLPWCTLNLPAQKAITRQSATPRGRL